MSLIENNGAVARAAAPVPDPELIERPTTPEAQFKTLKYPRRDDSVR